MKEREETKTEYDEVKRRREDEDIKAKKDKLHKKKTTLKKDIRAVQNEIDARKWTIRYCEAYLSGSLPQVARGIAESSPPTEEDNSQNQGLQVKTSTDPPAQSQVRTTPSEGATPHPEETMETETSEGTTTTETDSLNLPSGTDQSSPSPITPEDDAVLDDETIRDVTSATEEMTIQTPRREVDLTNVPSTEDPTNMPSTEDTKEEDSEDSL